MLLLQPERVATLYKMKEIEKPGKPGIRNNGNFSRRQHKLPLLIKDMLPKLYKRNSEIPELNHCLNIEPVVIFPNIHIQLHRPEAVLLVAPLLLDFVSL